MPFVPHDFTPPDGLEIGPYRLTPLGPEHNDSDYAAWTSSIDHIRATPGFEGASWPHEMTIDENLRDLQRHADDFAARAGFTYTVLAADRATVVGCLYIYPSQKPGTDVRVRSWVRAQDASLDPVLAAAVREWLGTSWPFTTIEYAPREIP
jgi:hypothetical protein